MIVDDLIQAVVGDILEAARSACQSRTLRAALTATVTPDGLRISVPHYWAPFFEQGRGNVSARPGHKLVFYRNPADDPRITGGYPIRRSDVRRLTKAEFYRDLKAGKLVVTDSVGPAPTHEFMGQALTVRARQLVELASAQAARKAALDALGPLLNSSVVTKF